MKKLIELIETKIKEAFVKSNYNETYGKVSTSDRPDLCEFQCNGALSAAKEYKKNPMLIAEEVVSLLEKDNNLFTI